VMTDAVSSYADDVRNGTYPSDDESYALPADAAAQLKITAPGKESPANESPDQSAARKS
jgi:hypothetical protein